MQDYNEEGNVYVQMVRKERRTQVIQGMNYCVPKSNVVMIEVFVKIPIVLVLRMRKENFRNSRMYKKDRQETSVNHQDGDLIGLLTGGCC